MENNTAPIRVLIIASDSMSTKLDLEKYLNDREKFQILGSTTSGLEGVEIAKDQNPDLVLINSNVDDMNALDVLRELKGIRPSSKFIVSSRANDPDWLRRAFNLGAANALSEPIIKEELIRVIQFVMQKKSHND